MFAHHLTEVLSRLEEDQYLILSAKHGNRCLQFACQGAWGMRSEVISNNFLSGDDRLAETQDIWLCNRGWNAPTRRPGQSTPDKDPDGSPNYYIDFPANVPISDIVSLAVDTLTQGLALPHPGALAYEAFDAAGGALEFRELGLKPAPQKRKQVMEEVLSVFRSVTGIEDLTFDEEGDLGVRYGEILVGAIHLENRVRLFSALVTEVAASSSLLQKLNQINDGTHQMRVSWRDDVVYATVDIPANPLLPTHLAAAMNEFSEVAEGLAIVLRATFAGKAVIEPSDPISYLQ